MWASTAPMPRRLRGAMAVLAALGILAAAAADESGDEGGVGTVCTLDMRQDAEKGDPEAAFRMAACLHAEHGLQNGGDPWSLVSHAPRAGTLGSDLFPPPRGEAAGDPMAWMEYSASLGNMHAAHHAATWHDALGNLDRAAELLHEAATAGNGPSQYDLAVCYMLGSGVEQNAEEALRWFKAAGKSGDPDGAMEAARVLGKELKRMEEAAEWFRVAADLGDARAMLNLGVLHQRGIGVAVSHRDAAKWFMAAVEAGHPDAERTLEKLLKKHPELANETPHALHRPSVNSSSDETEEKEIDIEAAAADGACDATKGDCPPDGSVLGDSSVTPAVEDPTAAELTAWVLANGATIRHLIAGVTRWGRGMVVTSSVTPGSLLLEIPAAVCLTTHTALARSRLAPVLRADEVVRRFVGEPDTGDIWALVLVLAFERHEAESHWAPYISSLAHPASPVWWGEEELAALQSEAAAAAVVAAQEDIRGAYAALMPHLIKSYPELGFSEETHTLESFTWAALNVWGRAFDLDHEGPNGEALRDSGLVPFMDLANHRAKVPHTKVFDGASVKFSASTAWRAGDEVLISYGDDKPTLTYLTRYGFMPPPDETDDFVVLVGHSATTAADSDGTPPSRRRALIAQVGIDADVSRAFLDACAQEIASGSQHVDPIPAATDKTDKEGTSSDRPIDQCVAASAVLAAVQGAIGRLPTSLAQDEATLAEISLGSDAATALQVRIRFKRILASIAAKLSAEAETHGCGKGTLRVGTGGTDASGGSVMFQRHITVGAALFRVDVRCSDPR